MRWPPSSAANESWPHEQFCQSVFDGFENRRRAGNSACGDVRLGGVRRDKGSLGTRIVTYADDLVILCRKGKAEDALQR